MVQNLRNKTLPYLSGRFFDGISSGLFMMALPWLMLSTPEMGTFVALIALACTGLSFVLTPFFSTLIDRHSRKIILIGVQVVQAATAGIIFVAVWFGYSSNWLLAFAQLVFWVSSNLGWATNNAFTQENYQPEEYASISGKQEIIMQGTTLGAGALGVVLLEKWGIVDFALFATLASSLAAISYIVTPYQRQLRSNIAVDFLAQLKESKHIFVAQPHFYAFLMLSSLSYPVLTYLGKLIPIWFAEVGISGDWVAAYNIAFGLGSLLTGLLVSRLLKLSNPINLILCSMSLTALALIAMSLSFNPIYLILSTLVFGFFNALNRIARTNWMHHSVPTEQRGRADGGLAMFSTSVQSVSYVTIALLSQYGYTRYGFTLAAIVLISAVAVMYTLAKQKTLSEALAV
tara:strand:+ start:779 stop:1984 length:1206 start_codon:yes stop_codon:yes gene_type:complete